MAQTPQREGLLQRRLSRRDALRGALLGAAGVTATALGCDGDDGDQPAPTATAGATPTSQTQASPTAEAAIGWRQLSPAGSPPPRSDHSLVWDPNARRTYLFGGRGGGTPLGDLWALDPEAPAWQQLQPSGDSPAARFGHNVAFDVAGGRMLVFGGQAGGDFFNDVWAYHPEDNRWERINAGSGPAQRYGAGAALDDGGSFWLTHGFTSQGRFDDTWSFDTVAGAWQDASAAAERPVRRCLMRAVYDPSGSRLLIFGGQTNDRPFLGDLWSYAINSRAWTQLDASGGPSPRNLYAAALDEAADRWLLFGGATDAGDSSEFWVFDLASDSWSPESYDSSPQARSAHDMAILEDGRLLLFGGAGADGELNDLWELRRSA